MNEDHKKRGLTHSKLLTAVAISSLLLSSGNVMAVQANPDKSFGVTEQLQAITISGLVVDAAGEPIIGASVVEKGTTNGGIFRFYNFYSLFFWLFILFFLRCSRTWILQ